MIKVYIPLNNNRLKIAIILGLIILTFAVYWQTKNNEFIVYDDGFIFENPHVQSGLNFQNIKWALTDINTDYWRPLTWISHMIDCELYGLNPAGHHLTNLLLHIANSVLLFLLLARITGAIWRSSFVAALFALHPLHVESVAWAAERKDVLSTLFFMLTIWAYIYYVEHRGLKRYLLSLVLFAFGLMSKPMLVTLPLILLLLDYWPLGRLRSEKDKHVDNMNSGSASRKRNVSKLVLEKVPFFAMAAILSVVTIIAQKGVGTLSSLESLSLKARIINAVVSYVEYIQKTFWPADLAVFYPYMKSSTQQAAAAFLLLCLTFLITRMFGRRRFLLVGWLWYLVTLLPVIGLIQVGLQARADRYTYIPLIGLFIMIVWGTFDFWIRMKYQKVSLAVVAGSILAIFSTLTWVQLHFWQTDIMLFEHSIAVTDNNYLAHKQLGCGLANRGRFDEAISHFAESLTLAPDYFDSLRYMGWVLAETGRYEQAVPYLFKVLRLRSNDVETHNILGYCFHKTGKYGEAVKHYSEAIRLNPMFAPAYNNIGMSFEELGRLEEAAVSYDKALRLIPRYRAARENLKRISGKMDQSVAE